MSAPALLRADYVFLGVPSAGLGQVIASLDTRGLSPRAAVVSLAKGLVEPLGMPPTLLLSQQFGPARVACVGGPAHAREMVSEGAALVAASAERELTRALAEVFTRAGVVCEESNDPIGVELAGVAKNAALWRLARPSCRDSMPPAPPPATFSPRSGGGPRLPGCAGSR